MIISGTELYHKCLEVLQKPRPTRLELDKVFHDLNLMLQTSFTEDDENIATLWFSIGTCLNKMGRTVMALSCFEEALKTKPDFIEAINNIGYVYKKLNHHQRALENFKKVIDLIESKPNSDIYDSKTKSEFYTNYGSMFVCNGTPEKAIEIFNKGDVLNPENLQNKYNKGLAQLETGDYENGFIGYDLGDRKEKTSARNYTIDNLPYWDGTPGKNVVVIGEQGIGDELMFGTIIPDLMKDCNVVIDAHPRLADMFRRSFPTIDVYGTRKSPNYGWGSRYKFDAKVLIGSLAQFYRKNEGDFPKVPYLAVNEQYNERYGKRLSLLGEKPKIGISWRGGTKQTGQNNRYIPLEEWLPILGMDCDFISLQYDHDIKKDVDEFCEKNKVMIHHWPEMLEDYEQTAALVNNLDLIISVPQSVIHLSGVIGNTITWQICPVKSLWQGGVYGHDMPWYANVSNIWQGKNDIGWKQTMETIKDKLCILLQMNTEN